MIPFEIPFAIPSSVDSSCAVHEHSFVHADSSFVAVANLDHLVMVPFDCFPFGSGEIRFDLEERHRFDPQGQADFVALSLKDLYTYFAQAAACKMLELILYTSSWLYCIEYFPVQDHNSFAAPSLLFAFVVAVVGNAFVGCVVSHAFASTVPCLHLALILVKMNHVIHLD